MDRWTDGWTGRTGQTDELFDRHMDWQTDSDVTIK